VAQFEILFICLQELVGLFYQLSEPLQQPSAVFWINRFPNSGERVLKIFADYSEGSLHELWKAGQKTL